jgi:predicted DNA binding CopG/RHH family protein
MDYTAEELTLLEAIEEEKVEKADFDNANIKAIAKQTQAYNQEKQQISINLKKSDLDIIKHRAKTMGISYQNIIQALVHNYSHNKLTLQI